MVLSLGLVPWLLAQLCEWFLEEAMAVAGLRTRSLGLAARTILSV